MSKKVQENSTKKYDKESGNYIVWRMSERIKNLKRKNLNEYI